MKIKNIKTDEIWEYEGNITFEEAVTDILKTTENLNRVYPEEKIVIDRADLIQID
jgi:hypothetical protein